MVEFVKKYLAYTSSTYSLYQIRNMPISSLSPRSEHINIMFESFLSLMLMHTVMSFDDYDGLAGDCSSVA